MTSIEKESVVSFKTLSLLLKVGLTLGICATFLKRIFVKRGTISLSKTGIYSHSYINQSGRLKFHQFPDERFQICH